MKRNKKKNKNNNKILIGLTLIIAIISIVISTSYIYSYFIGNSQEFTIVSEPVFIGQFFRAECVERPESMNLKTITSHTDEPTFYYCSMSETGTYVPLINGINCEYYVSEFSAVKAFECTEKVNEDEITQSNKCKSLNPNLFGDNSNLYSVNAGNYLYLNTNKIIGDATLQVRYPSYGLKAVTATNYGFPTTTSCLISSISNNYHSIGVIDEEVKPTVPFNVVTNFVESISTSVVYLNDISEDIIYISKPGYYMNIIYTDDNLRIVDTRQEFSDNRIECIPRTTGCSDEAKILTNLEEQSCDIFGGAITDYSPIYGDNTKLCKYNCQNGKLSLTSDCINVIKECPDNKPIWDSSTGECTILIDEDEKDDEPFNWLIVIFGVFGILIVIVLTTDFKKLIGGKK